jgi:hypothetical protein
MTGVIAWLGNDLAAYASVLSDDPDDLSITVECRTIDVCNVLQFLGSDGVYPSRTTSERTRRS